MDDYFYENLYDIWYDILNNSRTSRLEMRVLRFLPLSPCAFFSELVWLCCRPAKCRHGPARASQYVITLVAAFARSQRLQSGLQPSACFPPSQLCVVWCPGFGQARLCECTGPDAAHFFQSFIPLASTLRASHFFGLIASGRSASFSKRKSTSVLYSTCNDACHVSQATARAHRRHASGICCCGAGRGSRFRAATDSRCSSGNRRRFRAGTACRR